MISLALTGLEAALNKVIRLDPNAVEQLRPLEGRSIKIVITDWEMAFFILPYQHGLQLLSDYHKQPDTIISGKLINLIKVGAAGATTSALFEESISISGDTKTGEALRAVLKNLDIDWEEHLSKIVGDTIAHPIVHHVKKAIQFGKRSIQSLGENLAEYLHYESQQLPTKQSVETFISDVGQLRNDVDRMEARIKRLTHRKSKP